MEYKRKVLIVHNYYQIPGGEDVVVANEKELLEQHGHTVFLYSRSNSEIKNMRMVKKLLLPFGAVFNFRTYCQIKQIVKENEIDIVHVHNTWNLISPSVYYAARACRVPVVQTIHNFRLLCPGATFYREGRICEDCVSKGFICAVRNKCYRNSRMQTFVSVFCNTIHRLTGIYGKINYICLTEFNKRKLLQLKQISQDRVFVKPNFVSDCGGFVSAKDRANRIIYAGRLDKLKGVDILFEAWKQMGDDAPELVVCGTGPLGKWCKQFVADNHLEKIKLMGAVSNAEVRNLIATAKALILPTQWYEGFPMSIVEAFSVGTPVIGSDIGNVGDMIREGISGVKFDRNSSKALIDAIHILQNNQDDLYEKVYEYYLSNYSAEMNYVHLMEIYGKVTNGEEKQ